MRTERRRLVIDEDGPVRVSRRHSTIIVRTAGHGPAAVSEFLYSCRVELVVAPIAELRPRITHYFEEVVGETLDRGNGASTDANRFACGLTGGSAALIFLGALREADVDWSRVALYWGDERAVPPDSPDSNYGLAEQMLLKPLGARAPNAVRMQAELPDLKFAAKQYPGSCPRHWIFSCWVLATMGTCAHCFLGTGRCWSATPTSRASRTRRNRRRGV